MKWSRIAAAVVVVVGVALATVPIKGTTNVYKIVRNGAVGAGL